MTWRVFGGEHSDVYAALLRYRCIVDGLDTDANTIAIQFRLHLHRGIGYLVADQTIHSIDDLIDTVL